MADNTEQGNHDSNISVLTQNISQKTFLGIKILVEIGICIVFLIALLLLIILFCHFSRKKRRRVKHASGLIPMISKEVKEITVDQSENGFSGTGNEPEKVVEKGEMKVGLKLPIAKSNESDGNRCSSISEVSNLGWGRSYTMRELEIATDRFSGENMIGEGGYGIVYRGSLSDGSLIAVKNLMNNEGQAEKEFRVEAEAIGRVRHKNLVGLVGYCAEGAHRMLIYEYMDNGNLEQWLHGDVGHISPLTWDIRMKIAIGTAKGLAYLHEGLEPKVVHRDIKSSNILLDKEWNSKVSDFGLAKLLPSNSNFVTTRVMGTFGYVAPEYVNTGMLSEGSDVYSFGILLMEIISGRSPVDYNRQAGEVNLVDWFKRLVGSQRVEEVIDPLVEVKPPLRALKRVLLICLRCIDLDAQKRPKMGQVAHMLDADEFPFRAEHRAMREEILHQHLVNPVGRVRIPSNIAREIQNNESRRWR